MQADDELPDVLTPDEIARHDRVSYKAVVGWCERGQLKAYQLGVLWRIRKADYLAFRKHNTRPVVPAAPAGRKAKVGGPSRQKAADDFLDRVGV